MTPLTAEQIRERLRSLGEWFHNLDLNGVRTALNHFLYDLPRSWEATTRHREAEGSSYYRHFHMGLLREDGLAKPGLEV